jgi:hypothetical protein
MRRAAGLAIELVVGDATNRHARLLRDRQQLLQSLISAAASSHRHDTAGFQRFVNGVDSVDTHDN